LDKAALVVADMQRRLSAVERRLGPSAAITDEQAAQVALHVKALAELLTGKDPSKNHYQSIFGEIYRRWGVSSYKLLRQSQYQEVLAFLDDWHTVASGDKQKQDPV
jgi:hypothetical protein